MKCKLNISILLFLLLCISSYSQVVINEIMSSNRTCITDKDGDNPDWIELYNAGSEKVNLNSYYLSDCDTEPLMWQLPEVTINPKEYLLLFASGKNYTNANRELHTNFRISKDGEPILLSDPHGNLIDRLPPVFIETDYSFGRNPDNIDQLVLFKNPTPGSTNKGLNAEPIYTNLSFSNNPGYYEHDFLLNIFADTSVEIYYTTDGSCPIKNGKLYEYYIPINCRKGEDNFYSEIPTADPDHWLPPKGEVDKINIIRARPLINNIPVGKEIVGSFWIGHHNPNEINLPVVSIVTCPDNLFDYHTGISVPGYYYDQGLDGNSFRRGREWERDAHFSFFNDNGELKVNQNVGIRAHGGATRRYRQKTLRLYARSTYGKETINYPFFENRENDEFKRLLLNTTMGDWSATLFKDELCAYLVRDLNVDYLDFIPVISFVNGEYWGVQFLKERRDEYYIAQNHNVDPDNIDRITNNIRVSSGDDIKYRQLLDFLENADPKDPDTYKKLKSKIDIDNFIDYKCMQIFFNNRDWPHNNVECWRPRTSDGKWRWTFIDLDGGFRAYHEDNLTVFKDPEVYVQAYKEWGFFILRRLMKMPEFRKDFTVKFHYHLENTVRPDIVLQAIDKFRKTIEPHINNHINRWQFPSSLYEWEENLSVLESFAMLRPQEMTDLLKTNLLNPVIISPNPANNYLNIHKQDGIDLNSANIKLFDISGQSHRTIIKSMDAYNVIINISNLKSGVYLIQLQDRNMIYSKKFIKIN